MVEMRQPVPVRRQAENSETHLLLLKPERLHSQDRNRTSRQRKGNGADYFISPIHLWEWCLRELALKPTQLTQESLYQ